MQFSDKLTEIDETEESEEERAQLIAMRSAAASRSTWISVAVNLVLTTAQILVGVFAACEKTFEAHDPRLHVGVTGGGFFDGLHPLHVRPSPSLYSVFRA